MVSLRNHSKLKIICLTIIALACATIETRVSACFVCRVPYQSLLDKIEASGQAIIVRPVDQSQSKWEVVRVIKTNNNIKLEQSISLQDAGQNVVGQMQLLLRVTPQDSWTIECSIDRELLGFLTEAAELSSKQSALKRVADQSASLRFFLPFLEHEHPQIADSACKKLADAPYDDIRKLAPSVESYQLLIWINNRHIPKQRRALYTTLLGFCGSEHDSALLKEWIDWRWENGSSGDLAPMLIAHVELNGEETVRFIEQSYLLNDDRALDEIIEAVSALRVHGEADGVIPRSRILESFHLLLKERPALLELIIEDCARWKDWSIAKQLMDIYSSKRQPWNNSVIIKYLKACPNPEAEQFVASVSEQNDRANCLDD